MEEAKKEHFRIQFDRQNSKYNRLWGQLNSLALFFVGTLFVLILSFLEAIDISNISKSIVTISLIGILAIFCAICGTILLDEMENVKESIDGILKIFDCLAFKKDKNQTLS